MVNTKYFAPLPDFRRKKKKKRVAQEWSSSSLKAITIPPILVQNEIKTEEYVMAFIKILCLPAVNKLLLILRRQKHGSLVKIGKANYYIFVWMG